VKKTLIGLALLLAACGGAEAPEAAPAPPPAPAPAPAPEPEKDPYGYGDDAKLDGLWDECEAGDEAACDDLYWLSPLGSEYETYALERVNELAGVAPLTEQDIADAFGAAFFLDQVWAGMSEAEQVELCLGVGIFGPEVSASIIVSEAPTFNVGEVAEWLTKTCR
jgi:hypothetical protein